MAALANDTKTQILELGIQLIQQHGYQAFSYADIARALHIKNAAVHYHFPAKEDLYLAIVQYYIDVYQHMARQMNETQLSPKQQLDRFIQRYADLVDANKICIIGAASADYNNMPEAVKKKVTELVDYVLGLVEKTLAAGKRNGSFAFTETAKNQTMLLMTNLAAGVQLARITGKKDFENIRKSILKTIQA
ncbi:MAG: TetR/AcrR family transcriptional regulator [Sphingobacteriales bacterium]|jgi:TetR/AcrR family transcriptional regulator, transcriptional repressor for nem operon|nr:MAG: TetR/AcrR family transcriptional regulator [Sphingobacteriales bacterium]